MAFVSMLLFTLLFGGLYPAIVYVFALTTTGGTPDLLRNSRGEFVGIEGIGQPFRDSMYFHSRPSATSYGTMPSSGSNAAVTSSAFRDSVYSRRKNFARLHGTSLFDVHAEMVTTSGSGLDPNISHTSAVQQIPRIMRTRKLMPSAQKRLRQMVDEIAQKPRFRLVGLSTVDVVLLNLKLDEEFPIRRSPR